jgi:flagellum-specific peptidoglycan hydrolase FlgJ
MPASQIQLARLTAVVPAAQAAQAATKVPSSVTLAQWAVESTWGVSPLATEANNYFGIKAEHLNDPNTYEEFATHEYVNGVYTPEMAAFEKYPDAAASFADHARLLSTAPRYAPAMAVASDPQKFAAELQTCGYSTSPTYGATLWQIITQYKLTQYDSISG